MGEHDTTLAEVMDAHRVPSEMDAALARIRERMFASVAVTGRTVGRYVLIESIGEGGMGSITRAYDPRLHREVALKRLRSSGNAEHRGRLLREARAMAKLRHPNVVSVYDVELIDDELVIAMEYVRGVDLREWLRETRSPEEVLRAFVQAGRGLAAAHVEGLVHRDFKPANALVDESGRVQVTDFGLVWDGGETISTPSAGAATPPSFDDLPMDRTSADTALGTPRYMAPEQERGGDVDRRADVYAFCVALWEALAGDPPFVELSVADLRSAKLEGAPRWPKKVPVRRTILRALERGLQPSPSARWSTMAALLSAIEPRTRAHHHWWLALPLAAATFPLVMTSPAAQPLCDPEAATIWSADRSAVADQLAEIDGVFAEDVATRALKKLDAFADEYETRRARACDAKTDPTERELELACLGVGRARLENVVSVLGTVNSKEVPNVHKLLARLPNLSRCSESESSLAKESRDDPAVVKIKRQLGASYDLSVLSRYADAAEEAKAAMDAAQAGGLDVLWLDARLQVASIQIKQTRFEEAIASLREVLSLALLRGEDRVAARTASLLGSVLAARGSSGPEGVTLTQLALDLTPRTQDNASWTAALHTNAAIALINTGRPDKAAEIGRKALRVSLEGGLEGTVQHAQLLEYSAIALCQNGRFDDGLIAVNDAVALTRKLLGAHHPQLASPLGVRGQCRTSADDPESAIADFREALAIYETAYGRDDERVGVILDNLGLTLAQQADPFEAEQVMRRSMAIKARLYDERHLQTSHAQEGLAYALKAQGRFIEAEELFQASLQIRLANLGKDNLVVFHGFVGLANVAIDQGHVERGSEFLDEAERIARAVAEPESQVFESVQRARNRLRR